MLGLEYLNIVKCVLITLLNHRLLEPSMLFLMRFDLLLLLNGILTDLLPLCPGGPLSIATLGLCLAGLR